MPFITTAAALYLSRVQCFFFHGLLVQIAQVSQEAPSSVMAIGSFHICELIDSDIYSNPYGID